jgi:3'(2'), 5'-bisphosphate nucleotidase
MDTWIDAELGRALSAVREAAHATREVAARWREAGGALARDATAKDDASPVTVADLAAQALVSLVLGPDARLLGEETSAPLRGSGGRALREAVLAAVRRRRPEVDEAGLLAAIDRGAGAAGPGPLWILDPVDGTKGFLRGMQYAIALGRLEGGRITHGVLGCPHLGGRRALDPERAAPPGRWFAARRGAGAMEIDAASDHAEPLGVARHDGGAVRVGVSFEPAHRDLDAIAAWCARADLALEAVPVDSQAKYALVARGDLHAYIRIARDATRRENAWDHAAGMCVAQEAGACVTDAHGRPLDFTCGARLEKNSGILCAVPEVHDRLMAAR